MPEAPARLVKVLQAFDSALARVGCGCRTRKRVLLRVALDSAPPVRRDILLALAKAEGAELGTQALRVAAGGVAETTTRTACEDMQALGLLADGRDRGEAWRLDLKWGAVLAGLLAL